MNPGRYLLTVEAIPQNHGKNDKPVTRETLVVVHPMPPEMKKQLEEQQKQPQTKPPSGPGGQR